MLILQAPELERQDLDQTCDPLKLVDAMRSCIIFYENPDHNCLVLVPLEDLNQQI